MSGRPAQGPAGAVADFRPHRSRLNQVDAALQNALLKKIPAGRSRSVDFSWNQRFPRAFAPRISFLSTVMFTEKRMWIADAKRVMSQINCQRVTKARF
jgi:hypothetical protein